MRQVTFDKFVEGDITPTKKYLPYMLYINSQKDTQYVFRTIDEFIKEIKEFDELLPYIKNKDIYSDEYKPYNSFKAILLGARLSKEEKTFVKDEHIEVLIENEKFLLLRPKTHRGSLKYGNGTRWCTAAKDGLRTFQNYTNEGNIVYLIDKVGDKKTNYHSMAFNLQHKMPLSGEILIYNAYDSRVTEYDMTKNGWKENDVVSILFSVRENTIRRKNIKEGKSEVDKVVNFLEKIDLTAILNTLEMLKRADGTIDEDDYSKNIITNFINKIKTF